MTPDEIRNSGKLYRIMDSNDSSTDFYNECLEKMEEYNKAGYSKEGLAKKAKILHELFAEVGEGSYIQAPYYGMWGGHHVHLGNNVYINYNCTLIDDAEIFIGDNSMIGPNTSIITGTHPVSSKLRSKGYGYNKPVHIGKNVWLAANVTVLSGVTIGDNSVIGAGAIVTKDIPENSVAMGVPAKVVRKINDQDDEYYDGGKIIKDNLL